MVKVLDLEGVYKPTKIHTVLTKLLHLRYLGLRATFIEQLPDSLGELPFLETLDVKHTRVTDIYSRIWSAKEVATSLYLNWINEDDDAVVKYLPSTSISKLRTLWGLSLRNVFFVHNFLWEVDRAQKFGAGMRSKLRRKLSENSIPVLGGLPHLNILRLFADSYVGEELVFHPKSFPKLRVLKLWKLMNIGLLNFKENSMPCLRELEIRSCNPKLLIWGLKDLSALKDIELTNMPQLSWLVRLDSLKLNLAWLGFDAYFSGHHLLPPKPPATIIKLKSNEYN
ncbi:hypothetical protein Patl1_26295 [Pistacia atlantica]|uniref:Uncharacterized protein n=1 Tax=Pistacia atlantica TaxID=434234 RepID=A0ACC1B3X2_9ROSI|nr:hypothetical protein Patl1_26295 [Pistacia atlantica]